MKPAYPCPPGVDPNVWAALPTTLQAEMAGDAEPPDSDDGPPPTAPSSPVAALSLSRDPTARIDGMLARARAPEGPANASSAPSWGSGGNRLNTAALPAHEDDDEPPATQVVVTFYSDAFTTMKKKPALKQAPVRRSVV